MMTMQDDITKSLQVEVN